MSLEQTKFYNIKVEQDTTLDLPEDDATPADVYERSHGRCTTLYQDPRTQLQEYCQAPTANGVEMDSHERQPESSSRYDKW